MKPIAFLLCLAVGVTATARPADDTTAPPKTLRVITYNIHGGDPVTPTDQSKAALRSAHMGKTKSQPLALALGKLKPDIVALEETCSEKFVEQLAKEMAMDWAYFPGGWQDPERGWPEGIPTAILSRLPIKHRQNCPLALARQRPKDLFTRGYGRIRVALGDQQLAVYVAHLLPSWKNTTQIREAEIAEIAAAVATETAAGRSVLVMGDMNHDPTTPEYQGWARGGMIDTFAKKGLGPHLTCSVTELTERIDYVFASGPIAGRIITVRVLNETPFNLDARNPASYALSDHLPVMADFEMTHHGDRESGKPVSPEQK